MRSHAYLKRLYRQYNKKYFNNQLPSDIVVRFGTTAQLKKIRIGKKTCAVTFFKDGQAYAIIIKKTREKGWGYIKADLLHELCHVAHPRADHGPVFEAEMVRLAQAGAFKGIW